MAPSGGGAAAGPRACFGAAPPGPTRAFRTGRTSLRVLAAAGSVGVSGVAGSTASPTPVPRPARRSVRAVALGSGVSSAVQRWVVCPPLSSCVYSSVHWAFCSVLIFLTFGRSWQRGRHILIRILGMQVAHRHLPQDAVSRIQGSYCVMTSWCLCTCALLQMPYR